MALIVETGYVVPQANSYVSLDEALVIADYIGVKLGGIKPSFIEESLIRAAQRVDGQYASRYTGSISVVRQDMEWPRNDATKNGFPISGSSIPMAVKKAQVYAASEDSNGVNLMPNDDGKAVASAGVDGAVNISYFDNGKTGDMVDMIAIDYFLKPVLNDDSSEYSISLLR